MSRMEKKNKLTDAQVLHLKGVTQRSMYYVAGISFGATTVEIDRLGESVVIKYVLNAEHYFHTIHIPSHIQTVFGKTKFIDEEIRKLLILGEIPHGGTRDGREKPETLQPQR